MPQKLLYTERRKTKRESEVGMEEPREKCTVVFALIDKDQLVNVCV
jgi:hypothetical protein